MKEQWPSSALDPCKPVTILLSQPGPFSFPSCILDICCCLESSVAQTHFLEYRFVIKPSITRYLLTFSGLFTHQPLDSRKWAKLKLKTIFKHQFAIFLLIPPGGRGNSGIFLIGSGSYFPECNAVRFLLVGCLLEVADKKELPELLFDFFGRTFP